MNISQIRNFCIIAHIDHGKSTLADRMLELTGAVKKVKKKQMLDSMELEQERGITIKLKAVRMFYEIDGKKFQLNLIDTPGHVDFGYEVSRALLACEGALLLVDASQGIQAQTIANLEKAKEVGLRIIPVINKVDLPSAQIEETILQLIEFGFDEKEVILVSAKTGRGVKKLVRQIIEKIPPPIVDSKYEQERALVFDSYYDEHRGIVAFVRVVNGTFESTDVIKFVAAKSKSNIVELGYLSPKVVLTTKLKEGEVGFVATGLKNISKVRVGDTVTLADKNPSPIAGYKEPVPVVFVSFYPQDSSEYLKLREAMEKLKLSDAAFTYTPESIGSVGRGFRCGFLGSLHADIIRERIEREFGISIIAASPSVRYLITTTKGEGIEIVSAADYPDPSVIKEVKEPWARLDIYTTSKYVGAIMEMCKNRRAEFVGVEGDFATSEVAKSPVGNGRVKITYNIPLIELIVGFYDKLKSVSSGYASINYEVSGYRLADVVRMDILVAESAIPPLAQLVQKDKAQTEGKRMVEKLRELIPRQQFKVSIQAAIGGKIVARENISPARKDVTGHLYGGDVTRKRKLLEKQKKGKARMKRFGKVAIPQDVFWKVMEK